MRDARRSGDRDRRCGFVAGLAAGFALAWTAVAAGERPVEDYAGSFRLESGEVLTGGYFAQGTRIVPEGEEGSFLYVDVDGLAKGPLLFRRESELVLRSLGPPDGATLEFVPGPDGGLDEVVWREEGRPPVRGARVYPHTTHRVAWRSADGTEIVGQLLVPDCPGPHPLMVLVGGSGPTVRHGATFDTHPLQLGIATLTYDKRGVHAEDWSEPGFETLAADAAAALRWAVERADVDPARAGYWGSSQGGWVAPIAATEEPAPAYLVVRAGPGVSSGEAFVHEVRQENRQEGLGGSDLDHATALLEEIQRMATAGRPLAATDALVAPYLDEPWYRTAFGEGPISERWSATWWSWGAKNWPIGPEPYLARVDLPVLWFLAEYDQNVPLVPSRAALARAFAASPGSDETIVVIEDADHGFFVTDPDGTRRYTPDYFGRLRDWLTERGFTDEDCWP